MLLKRLKSYLKQIYLRHKFRKGNTFGEHVIISKDTEIQKGAFIGAFSVLGPRVRLSRNVRIGKNTNLSNISVEENSFIESEVICTGHGSGTIKIGKDSYIGIRNILDWSDNIEIGNYVHIAGPSTGIWTHSSAEMCLHGIPLAQKDDKRYRSTAPVIIEDNVYIAGNCTIYPGVTINHHSIVAPNSAVTKDVYSYTMVGGVPAKLIKKINLS